jgi:hypothetical protein
MSAPLKIIGAEHVQAAVDAVLGVDPSQAPTNPVELNERLTHPQAGITESLEFLISHQASKHMPRGLPLVYVMLEAADRAFPTEMQEELRSKSFFTALAAVTVEAKAAASGDGTITGPLKERQPELIAFIERHLAGENGVATKMSQDDRAGLYALCLGTVRAIERHFLGAEKPVQVAKKIGPNEPCSCGSGKKFKKCHGGPNAPAPAQA